MVAVVVFLLLGSTVSLAQTTISGTVTDANTKETLLGVNIQVKGKVTGTISDLSGKYSLKVNQEAPFTLVFSFVGFETKEVEIKKGMSTLSVELSETSVLGQDVVVSASRVEESILRSPV